LQSSQNEKSASAALDYPEIKTIIKCTTGCEKVKGNFKGVIPRCLYGVFNIVTPLVVRQDPLASTKRRGNGRNARIAY
jgi:hypothetical protein